jgi:hypothetical protein
VGAGEVQFVSRFSGGFSGGFSVACGRTFVGVEDVSAAVDEDSSAATI